MEYTIDYVIKIAKYKFGEDEESVNAYVKTFDPAKPSCQEDERNYLAALHYEEEQKRDREDRDRVTAALRYLSALRGDDGLLSPFRKDKPEEKEKREEDPFRLRASVSFEAFIPDYSVPYHRHIEEIQKRFGFHHDAEEVKKVLVGISEMGEKANEAYKTYFCSLFAYACALTENADVDRMELLTDLENMMGGILESEIFPRPDNAIDAKMKVHAGMSGAELVSFVNGFASLADEREKEEIPAPELERDPLGLRR